MGDPQIEIERLRAVLACLVRVGTQEVAPPLVRALLSREDDER